MINGILIINKHKGCTSHDIVSKAKKIFGTKVGHTGTLDPNAEGVLPLLLGQGTKLSYYLINHDKEYIVTLQLGEKRDTADVEGNILEKRTVNIKDLDEIKINNVLKSFIGKQKQIPPIYSAIKVNGKKLYEYARKNEQVELKPRDIEIYGIQLMQIEKESMQIIFKVQCSKGTYIRSLCENIAEKLNTVGYMKDLKRTIVGKFNINQAITINELEQNKDNIQFLKDNIITIEQLFKSNSYIPELQDKNEIKLNDRKLNLFLNGVNLAYNLKDGLYRIYNYNEKFVGIGMVKNNLLKREIIVENY